MSFPFSGTDEATPRSKIETTVNAIISILGVLRKGDRFGCVVFNDVRIFTILTSSLLIAL